MDDSSVAIDNRRRSGAVQPQIHRKDWTLEIFVFKFDFSLKREMDMPLISVIYKHGVLSFPAFAEREPVWFQFLK